MSSAPRKVQVKFPGGSRWYTYLYDPERDPLRVGDRVEVPANSFAVKPDWAEVVCLGSDYLGACRMIVRRVPPEPWLREVKMPEPAPRLDHGFGLKPRDFNLALDGFTFKTVEGEWDRVNTGPAKITPLQHPLLTSNVEEAGRIAPPRGDVFQEAKMRSHRKLMQDFKRVERAALSMVRVFEESVENYRNLDLVEAVDRLRDALEDESSGMDGE